MTIDPAAWHDPAELTPEALQAFLARYDGVDLTTPHWQTDAGLNELLRYLFALSFSAHDSDALHTSDAILACIDRRFAANPTDEMALEALLALNQLTGRYFTLYERDQLTDYEYYNRVIQRTAHAEPDAPGRFIAEAVRARLGLLQSMHLWQQQGGRVEKLPDEQLQVLKQLHEEYPKAAQEQVESWLAKGQTECAILVQRAMGTYYATTGKPNDAIQVRKALLQLMSELPETAPHAHTTDRAELNMEIGGILAHHQKFKAAVGYLAAAQALYAAAGEAYESLALQAETLADDCRQKA